jgi:hypothetical protein
MLHSVFELASADGWVVAVRPEDVLHRRPVTWTFGRTPSAGTIIDTAVSFAGRQPERSASTTRIGTTLDANGMSERP